MYEKLGKFLDLDLNRVGAALIYEEFNHKFANSWVILDGSPTYITKFYIKDTGEAAIACAKHDGKPTSIQDFGTIENFSPKTGLYSLEDTLLYLKRVPNRQWTKGFSPGNNYEVITLKNTGPIKKGNRLDVIFNPKTLYNAETIIHKKELYLHWKHIGNVDINKQKITLFNDHFEKETKELWKQFSVISDVNLPKNVMEENLIVDF